MLIKNQIYEGRIEDYTAQGQGIAKIEGCAVFVPNAIAGELGADAPVVVTGEGAAAMVALLRHEARADDTLTLRGLWDIWRLNARA